MEMTESYLSIDEWTYGTNDTDDYVLDDLYFYQKNPENLLSPAKVLGNVLGSIVCLSVCMPVMR